jgi:mono/diheme cytochrome c family protein
MSKIVSKIMPKIMRVMKSISLALVAVVSIVAISNVAGAQPEASLTPPTVKRIPISNVPSNSGKEMFISYCAVCHGKDAKGDGPAASAMKTPPTDLTLLAQRNGGKYAASHVSAVLKGQAIKASHGDQDMPVWGPLFSTISQGNEAQVQQRISNLVSYVGSLQAK